MKTETHGLVMAAQEHLISGKPITRLEAMVLYGVPDLTKLISDMRRKGWIIETRKTPYAAAVKRINQHAVLTPPANLPVREIILTEYWVSK
jgi:hypothetical protein